MEKYAFMQFITTLLLLMIRVNLTMIHQYWFNLDHPHYKGNDNNWNYCDYKCITLE